MITVRFLVITALCLVSLTLYIDIDSANASPCTPGVNCYCDKVKNPANSIYDPSLLMCEDFEAPTLIKDQGVGNGAPWYGPPYDSGGQTSPNDRGRGGYWQRVYGNGVNGALWDGGTPANPKLGQSCGFSLCTGLKIWSVGDLWDANNYGALAAFLTNGQYTAEPHLTAPTGASGGGSGSFDGVTSLFSRVPAGNTAGIYGTKFWTKTQTFGITAAVAYASNLVTSGLMNSNWKGDEWVQNKGFAGGDGLFLFGNPPFSSIFPFYGFTFAITDSQSTCNSKVAAATKTAGSFRCDAGGNFIFEASSAQYNQSTDWPLGRWACVRAYYQNMGSANSSIQMWLTGSSGVEKKIIDISGMDLTGQTPGRSPAGYEGFAWNNYANTNQPPAISPSTETSGRYQDNYHVRSGSPVSCSQIGFAGGSVDSTPPSAPTNLRIS